MRQVDPNKFKVSPSSSSQIMAGNVGLTEKQEAELKAFKARHEDEKAKPLTANMIQKMTSLQAVKDNPQLPQGAKTYCKNWHIKTKWGRRKDFTSIECDKGNEMEAWAIEFVADHFDAIMVKNETTLSTEYIEGTHDQNTGKKVVRDFKCPRDIYTFPHYETECFDMAYWWQLQCYMATTGCERAELIYVLCNTPDHLIERTAKKEAYNRGEESVTQEMYDHYERLLTYDDMEPQDRIKVFHIERDNKAIQAINERVILCRKYIATLCQ